MTSSSSSEQDATMVDDLTPIKQQVPRIQFRMTKVQEQPKPSTTTNVNVNVDNDNDDSEEEMEYETNDTIHHHTTNHHISPTPQKTKPTAAAAAAAAEPNRVNKKNDLTTSVLESLRDRKLNFAINEECRYRYDHN